MILQGEPNYDPDTDSVVLDNLKIKMKTNNILMKGAGLIFKNKIKDLVQNGVAEQINQRIAQLKLKAQEQLNTPKLPKGMNLDAKIEDLKILNVSSVPEGLSVLLNLTGHVKILIDDLPDK